MGGDDWVLGVDVGTSRSAGAMANGVVTPLEVDGNRWMPSMVLLDPDGHLVVGAAADNQAGVYPDRVERTPKRHLGGSTPLLLGGQPVEVQAAIAKLISVFVEEGQLRRDGRTPVTTVLTHPVRWGDARKTALADSARQIGLEDLILIEEPVAAAVHYVGDRVEVGECVGVYDLGGGTFDTAVLRRTPDGFETIGAPGGDEFIGGEHFDHMVFDFLGDCLADDDPAIWEEIQYGEDRRWTRAAADLLTQARRAKEAVSSYPSTQVVLPLVDRDVVLTRNQFESMIRDQVEATVEEMATTITSAGLAPDDLEAIYLVGGSSRIPLVTQLMTERFGARIATRDEPKSVVALGAALVGRSHHQRSTSDAASTGATPVDAEAHRSTGLPPGDRPGSAPTTWPTGPAVPTGLTAGTAGGQPVLAPPPSSFRTAPAWTAPPPPALPPPPGSAPPATAPPPPSGPRWPPGPAAPTPTQTATNLPPPPTSASIPSGTLPPPPSAAVPRPQARPPLVAPALATAWQVPLPSPVQAMGMGPGVVHVTVAARQVHQFEANGRWRWSAELPAQAHLRPLTVEQAVYFATADGQLSALALPTGQRLFHTKLSGSPAGSLVSWGTVVVACDATGTVSALDRQTGRPVWILPLADQVTAPLALAGNRLLVATMSGRVYLVSPSDGRVSWAFPAPVPVTAAPVVDGDAVFVAATNGTVYALDLVTGRPTWGVQVGGPVDGAGVVVGGSYVVADRSGQVSALSRADGSVTWEASTNGTNPTGLVSSSGLLFCDTGNEQLAAIRPADGQVVGVSPHQRGSWLPPTSAPGLVLVRDGTQVRALRAQVP